MTELSFEIKKKTAIKVGIYGEEYEIRKPLVSDVDLLTTFSDSADDKDKLEKTIELMAKLGLPSDVSRAMEIDHFTKLVEYVFGAIKKN